jgi:toxin FitB
VNYLIDTNVISELRKGERCHPNVAAWFNSIDDADLYLSVLVVGEIRRGIERARLANPDQARALEIWLVDVGRAFAGRILAIDREVADEWGRMSAKRSVSTVDTLLAATAKFHRMTLATRNVSDVADLGADILNPFEAFNRAW